MKDDDRKWYCLRTGQKQRHRNIAKGDHKRVNCAREKTRCNDRQSHAPERSPPIGAQACRSFFKTLIEPLKSNHNAAYDKRRKDEKMRNDKSSKRACKIRSSGVIDCIISVKKRETDNDHGDL